MTAVAAAAARGVKARAKEKDITTVVAREAKEKDTIITILRHRRHPHLQGVDLVGVPVHRAQALDLVLDQDRTNTVQGQDMVMGAQGLPGTLLDRIPDLVAEAPEFLIQAVAEERIQALPTEVQAMQLSSSMVSTTAAAFSPRTIPFQAILTGASWVTKKTWTTTPIFITVLVAILVNRNARTPTIAAGSDPCVLIA